MRTAVAIVTLLGILIAGLTPGAALPQQPQASGTPTPLPLAEYWQLVEGTRTAVRTASAEPALLAHFRLEQEAGRWQAVESLLLDDGTAVPLSSSGLVALLRANPPDLPRIDGLLSTLLAAHGAQRAPVDASAQLHDLGAILARPEFQWVEREPSLLEKWWQWLNERLWDLLGQLLPAGDIPVVRYALTAVGLLALAAALFYALRGILGGLIGEKELDPDDAGDERLTADGALQRAQALAGGGDYRSAVRYLYLSSLLLLEEHGLLRYDRSLTNREYLRSVARFPDLAAALRQVIEVFERVWYGYQPLDEAAYARYAQWVADLQRMRSITPRLKPGACSTTCKPD